MKAVLFLCLSLVLPGYLCADNKTQKPVSDAVSKNAGLLDGYEVLRCQFADRKIVARREQQVIVVSAGQLLPKTEIRLVRIGEKQAVFEKQGSRGKELILLEEKEGIPVLRRLSGKVPTHDALPSAQQPVVLESKGKEKQR